jgi:hypothetical protein
MKLCHLLGEVYAVNDLYIFGCILRDNHQINQWRNIRRSSNPGLFKGTSISFLSSSGGCMLIISCDNSF